MYRTSTTSGTTTTYHNHLIFSGRFLNVYPPKAILARKAKGTAPARP